MVFLLLGVVLLLLKLSGVEPFLAWEWFTIAVPFLLAICWFELLEPILGLDARREQRKQAQFAKKAKRSEGRFARGQGPMARKNRP